MRLINTDTLELEEYFGSDIPAYAILSRTWGKGEVLFQDWIDRGLREAKPGYRKITMACNYASGHGHRYLWVDTNCIDKTSSAELTEAINSMFTWYQRSTVCYAYLEDVPLVEFVKSRWFTRGWTLQELLAPEELIFFDRQWQKLGDKSLHLSKLSEATGIESGYLDGSKHLDDACDAEKMSWVSHRFTTRVEDMAYCMLGIFNINMPMLYGEGEKAFTRLQQEIIRNGDDQSIFCWTWHQDTPDEWSSILAPHPSSFSNYRTTPSSPVILGRRIEPYSITNQGLRIRLPILSTWSYFLTILGVGDFRDQFL
ncbi:uncharacterized protein Z520_02575 [Fonsecaea multimorphosa CBS 102226]|uniref:Uncharacterized protein n=1 Tax=Fonsecaea multimorphosa CBS 102226 TaxID=1442371 RepID=A0A0D2HKQ6_9EURO|nr:uncharacterized protein Z520_02575 [Fonsecaea multimorphosa CBS 102226]KIY02436.1 hypothetical protein Z520_02575 [Fonsecaea multimorphosa CBS 102226]OAL29077.1 hypothetical protein AYO22_02514 [Fonsecaea multimorphosa]